jgi:hypothetical protein
MDDTFEELYQDVLEYVGDLTDPVSAYPDFDTRAIKYVKQRVADYAQEHGKQPQPIIQQLYKEWQDREEHKPEGKNIHRSSYNYEKEWDLRIHRVFRLMTSLKSREGLIDI